MLVWPQAHEMVLSQVFPSDVSILKCLWCEDPSGTYRIHDMKGLKLGPPGGCEDPSYFSIHTDLQLLTERPPLSLGGSIYSFAGPAEFLTKQSILPVVEFLPKSKEINCVGTAFLLSCSGYVVTATHVIIDPIIQRYTNFHRTETETIFNDEFIMGVLTPLSPDFRERAWRLSPFQEFRYWGDWIDPPLVGSERRFDALTDISVGKIKPLPGPIPHQPLTPSFNSFTVGETAMAIGYAEMPNITVVERDKMIIVEDFPSEIYVSIGKVLNNYPNNHETREVRTPGPCFDFNALIPGRMSGAPIFGAKGAVVRGVVSSSFSGIKHAYGCTLGAVIDLPLTSGQSIRQLLGAGSEGIAKVNGDGL